MYVCGPTVYAPPHIGNARPIVVYDVLYRLLKHSYNDVKYVRNITDVDDKILVRAQEEKTSADNITQAVIEIFYQNTQYLNCLSPDVEPLVTTHMHLIH